MNATHRSSAGAVVLAVVGSGCGQGTASPTTSAPGSTTAAEPSTSPSTAPSAGTGTAVIREFTACVPTNDGIKTGTPETEVISGLIGDVTVARVLGSTWKGAITATDRRFSGTHYWTASSIKDLQPRSDDGLTAFILDTDGPCLFNLRGMVRYVSGPPVSYTDG